MGLQIGEQRSYLILATSIDDNPGSLLSYGAQITTLKASAPGETVPLSLTEAALTGQNYKLIIVTHVDTSTGESVEPSWTSEEIGIIDIWWSGVLSDIKSIAEVVKRVSPSTLVRVLRFKTNQADCLLSVNSGCSMLSRM